MTNTVIKRNWCYLSNFVQRFKSQDELVDWLKSQRKDYLYSLYMQDTNYDGLGYRKITRNNLKDIFLDTYNRIDK